MLYGIITKLDLTAQNELNIVCKAHVNAFRTHHWTIYPYKHHPIDSW